MVNRSVVVHRRVEGLYKVSKRRSEVLKEGIVGVGVQGSKEVKDRGSRFKSRLWVGGSIQVCIRVYNFW